MIKLEKVNKYYNKGKKNQIHVIDNTSLELGEKGLVALLGPSGCGKTTLLNVIGGLDKIKKGKIYVNGQKISTRRSYKVDKIRNLNIGYIFQDYKLIDNLSVYDNVAIVLKMIGIKDKNEIKKRVEYILNSLNIYRFKSRPASMLSGGQRQRVGIARALVKDPDIILADEPTGNLDSKNSLEIMNIIKAISKNRLVILVTHETELAHFYADRIIEIEDGKIEKDYTNDNKNGLDYRIENNIYLKDLKHQEVNDKNLKLQIYENKETNLNITLVVQNGNIYIKNEGPEKVEVIGSDSNIELINDHYKTIAKEDAEKYNFDFQNIISKDFKKRYSSIFNPITFIKSGFKKIINYKPLKKFLLLGYMAAAMFILFSVSRIAATLVVKDKDFIKYNDTYIQISTNKLNVADYNKVINIDDINYAMPGDSLVSLPLVYNNLLQTTGVKEYVMGSLASVKLLKNEDILYGVMPVNKNEIAISKTVAEKVLSNGYAKEAGINTINGFVGKIIRLDYSSDMIVTGIVDTSNPSVYAFEEEFTNILYNNALNEDKALELSNMGSVEYTLKEGKNPENVYEIIVPYSQRYAYPLNEKVDEKINDKKLKVVGYYLSSKTSKYITNEETMKMQLINNSRSITISSNDKETVIEELKNREISARDTYEIARNEYVKDNESATNAILIFSAVIIVISLIEVFLMIRSSFLSRIREIGIYRAIGVKKKDIYKMFLGEILAISFTASLGGIILMTYVLYNITQIKFLTDFCVLNPFTIGISVIICFGFNIIVGLIPVANTMRKRPAEILSRKDI